MGFAIVIGGVWVLLAAILLAWHSRKKLRKAKKILEPNPEATTSIKPGAYVHCDQHQSAECPLTVGGVYQVLSTEKGRLQFRQCGRDHDPDRFHEVTKSMAPTRLTEHSRVELIRKPSDHICQLRPRHPNQRLSVGQVDDFNRVCFYHQGCTHWHDPADFQMALEKVAGSRSY